MGVGQVADSSEMMKELTAYISEKVVKGKSEAVEVWEPLHDDQVEKPFLKRYCEAFARLERLAPEAVDLFQALHDEHPNDPCVAMHLRRLRRGVSGVQLS